MSSKKKRIMICDDNQGFVIYLSVILNRMGFQVIPVEDSLEALKLMKILLPDMVIMEKGIRAPDGASFIERLKSGWRTRNLPVAIVSSNSSEEAITESMELGASAYLVKPLDIDDLHDTLQKCLFTGKKYQRIHLRVPYRKELVVSYDNESERLKAATLSEGGIYLCRQIPLKIGTEMTVELPLGEVKGSRLKGSVVYRNTLGGDNLSFPEGMAVKFNLPRKQAKALSNFIKQRLAEEI